MIGQVAEGNRKDIRDAVEAAHKAAPGSVVNDQHIYSHYWSPYCQGLVSTGRIQIRCLLCGFFMPLTVQTMAVDCLYASSLAFMTWSSVPKVSRQLVVSSVSGELRPFLVNRVLSRFPRPYLDCESKQGLLNNCKCVARLT